jgi:N-acetylmuramoyl-L-alanine amidase
MKIAISAGHGSKIRGMSDIIDEVDEARRVCNQVCSDLFDAGVKFEGPFFDDVSTEQNENLQRICDWHNSKSRDLDVSVHFNANQHTSKPVGTEVWYVTQEERAADMATAIAEAGELKDRGPKYSNSLYFLGHTEKPAILLEICFGDSQADVDAYRENFRTICAAIAAQFGAEDIAPVPEPDEDALLHVEGACSWFGGPDDDGVSPSEGLAFLYEVSDAPDLFLPEQPPGTTGLARRLDPDVYYVACRWDYSVTSKDMLRDQSKKALVRANDLEFLARPADWGPNENTGRVADLSPGLMDALGIDTDDEVEVIYPAPGDQPQPGPEPEVATVDIQISASGPVRITVNGTEISEL